MDDNTQNREGPIEEPETALRGLVSEEDPFGLLVPEGTPDSGLESSATSAQQLSLSFSGLSVHGCSCAHCSYHNPQPEQRASTPVEEPAVVPDADTSLILSKVAGPPTALTSSQNQSGFP